MHHPTKILYLQNDGEWSNTPPPPVLHSLPMRRRLPSKVWIKPNWLMISLLLLALPSVAFLLESSRPPEDVKYTILPLDSTGLFPPPEFDFTADEVVDSIIESISSTPVLTTYVADPESKFAQWMWYVKVREGYVGKTYRCPAGKRTIGYGHNIDALGHTPETSNGRVTYSEASMVLYRDIQDQYNTVTKLLPHLNKNQRLAVTSLAANCGLAKIMYTGGSPRKGYSQFWKACRAGHIPNFGCYTRYRTPGGKIVESPNLVSARSFEQLLYQGHGKARIFVGMKGRRPTYKLMDFNQAAEHYRQILIKRDIVPAKQAGTF